MLDLDIKTVRKHIRQGVYKPYSRDRHHGLLTDFKQFIELRAPEVDFNGQVLYREIVDQGYQGSYELLKKLLHPWREQVHTQEEFTRRFETGPGQQSQVDWGSKAVWLGEQPVRVHLFVLTLGFSRRTFVHAFRNERLACLIDGHEKAFEYLGGRAREILYDNPKTMVLRREADGQARVNPKFEDFVDFYGFKARFCQPYRARTKGKVESGVKYVKRNFLADRRFYHLDHLNKELEHWMAEVADQRIHGTTKEKPIERFQGERLIAITADRCYHSEQGETRRVRSDAMVSYRGNHYSVPWQQVGRNVSISLKGHSVAFLIAGDVIACHPLPDGKNERVINPDHFLGMPSGGKITALVSPPLHDPRWEGVVVSQRDLRVYDEISGLMGGGS